MDALTGSSVRPDGDHLAVAGVHGFLDSPGRLERAWSPSAKPGRGSRFGRLIFVAGSGDLDNEGNVCNPNRIGPQVDAAMDELARVIESLNGRACDIIKLVAFHTADSPDGEAEILRHIRGRLTSEVPPVVSLIALPRLWAPGLNVLIKAVAVDNRDGRAPRQVPGSTPGWPLASDFSNGLRCGEMVFVGAQTAVDRTGSIRYQDDIVSQAKLTIENIAGVLDSLGCDLDDVVKLNTWYLGSGTDADWRGAAEVRSSAFRFPGPGATGVPVPRPYPDGALIRQECLAVRGVEGSRLPRALSWPLGHWDWPVRVSFQQGIRVGRLIVLGGQYSMDERGLAVHPDQMQPQIDTTMEFIRRILEGFGARLEDLVEVTCFYRYDSAVAAPPLGVVSFGSQRPPVTEVPLATMGLEHVTLEVEGFAIMPEVIT